MFKNIVILILTFAPLGCAKEREVSTETLCNPGTTKNTLSVMTYNVHIFDIVDTLTRLPFLKVFIQDLMDTLFHRTKAKGADFRDAERTHFIAERILAMQNPPDIIVFTELWSDPLAQSLTDKLRSLYAFSYRPEADSYIFEGKIFGNGLLLLSKYPTITGTQLFTPYSSLEGPDDYTVKGVGQVSLQICEGPKIAIFMTHTQSPYLDNPQAAESNRLNLRQLADIVGDFKQKNPNEGMIIAGDLNLSNNSPSYFSVVDSLNAVDAYRSFYPDHEKNPGYTYDARFNDLLGLFAETDIEERERFDYIFFHKDGPISGIINVADGNPSMEPIDNPLCSFIFVDVVTGRLLPLSDHYPVRVDFRLKTHDS